MATKIFQFKDSQLHYKGITLEKNWVFKTKHNYSSAPVHGKGYSKRQILRIHTYILNILFFFYSHFEAFQNI